MSMPAWKWVLRNSAKAELMIVVASVGQR